MNIKMKEVALGALILMIYHFVLNSTVEIGTITWIFNYLFGLVLYVIYVTSDNKGDSNENK